MAERHNPQKTKAAPKGAADVKDLGVLLPDHEISINGQVIVVREYRFVDGLKLRTQARPFFDDLYALFDQSGEAPGFDDVMDLMGSHEDLVVDMVAKSCGQPEAWIRTLDDTDGDALFLTWWLANAGFFIRRVMRRAAKARIAPARQPSGEESSTPSSPPGTSESQPTSND